jgi:hypothetical protein
MTTSTLSLSPSNSRAHIDHPHPHRHTHQQTTKPLMISPPTKQARSLSRSHVQEMHALEWSSRGPVPDGTLHLYRLEFLRRAHTVCGFATYPPPSPGDWMTSTRGANGFTQGIATEHVGLGGGGAPTVPAQ